MAKFSLSASPAHFEKDEIGGRGYTTFICEVTSWLMRSAGYDQEAKDLNGIRTLVKAFGDKVAEANPGVSFHVSVVLKRGERKPNGFDKAFDDRKGDPLGTYAWVKLKEAA